MPQKNRTYGFIPALLSAVTLGASSTFGDWLWANYLTDGALLPAVVHGAAIFLLLALVLSTAAGTREAARRLFPTLPITGVLIAALFYPLASVVGYIGALLVSWATMWLATAALQRWARGSNELFEHALLRGALAAIGSGVAFWLISGMWTAPSPEPIVYPARLLSWTFAFLPGFLALLVAQRSVDRND